MTPSRRPACHITWCEAVHIRVTVRTVKRSPNLKSLTHKGRQKFSLRQQLIHWWFKSKFYSTFSFESFHLKGRLSCIQVTVYYEISEKRNSSLDVEHVKLDNVYKTTVTILGPRWRTFYIFISPMPVPAPSPAWSVVAQYVSACASELACPGRCLLHWHWQAPKENFSLIQRINS